MESGKNILDGVVFDLRWLSEAWRKKATGIEVRHRETDPHTAEYVVAALETCAEEIEALVKAAEARKP
jgi:hypothetical protein